MLIVDAFIRSKKSSATAKVSPCGLGLVELFIFSYEGYVIRFMRDSKSKEAQWLAGICDEILRQITVKN